MKLSESLNGITKATLNIGEAVSTYDCFDKFSHITELKITKTNSAVRTIDLSPLIHLKRLEIKLHSLREIIGLECLSKLEYIDIENTKMDSINLFGNKKLVKVELAHNKLLKHIRIDTDATAVILRIKNNHSELPNIHEYIGGKQNDFLKQRNRLYLLNEALNK